jgi:hypothetical protein
LSSFEKLVQAYGKLPSFHDAHILRVERSANQLNLLLYLYEPPVAGLVKQNWDSNLHVVCMLAFSNVRSFRLTVKYNSLSLAKLEEVDGLTFFTMYGETTDEGGEVVAGQATVETVDMVVDRFQWKGKELDVLEIEI